MLKVLLLFSFILISIFSHSQWYWKPVPLHKGDFLKVAANNYTAAFEYELIEGEKALTRLLEFGAQGLPALLVEKGINDNGDTINSSEVSFKFDGNGRLIRETTMKKTDGDEWSNVYTYTKTGRLVKKQTITIDPATTFYTYNAKGKLTKTNLTIRMAIVDEEGNLTAKRVDMPRERTFFIYDAKGRLKEMQIYDLTYSENDKITRKLMFSYNDRNQLTQLQRINEEGAVYNTETYEYNNDGLLVKSTIKDDENTRNFIYEYCSTCKQSWK